MEITYKTNVTPKPADIIRLYDAAELPRPTGDMVRIAEMFANSDLVVTAWDRTKLVGISRSITDFRWSCYLADLAVDPAYQKHGIGRRLVQKTGEALGPEVMILLLSVPGAMEYYPKIGFENLDNAFMIQRAK
jgi:GNAT superfamily N-acetyltransferase